MLERSALANSRWRIFLSLTLFLCLVVGGNYLTHIITNAMDFEIRPSNEDIVHRTILSAAALYTVLLAIPFVPGAEIGLALIAMLGPPIVLLVYICTVVGLTISFLLGRLIPLTMLIRLVQELGLKRTTSLLKSIEPLNEQQRLAALIEKTPTRILPFLLRHRYVALAAALNLPGNFLVGGGGGIALFAGVSRLFSTPAFFATIMIAVSPVPLAVLALGAGILDQP